MSSKVFKEVGINALVGVAVFGWIFSQSPSPQEQRAAEIIKIAKSEKQAGKRGDQIPTVAQKAPKEIKIEIQPVSLQTPGQALQATENLLEVTATSLKMRTGPSSSYDLVDVYARGSTFEKIGQDGNWLQVRSTDDGSSGWMFADYLQSAN